MIAQLDPWYIRNRPGKATARILSHLLFQGRFLTTRYRWLNGPILAWLRLAKGLPLSREVHEPVFIVGTGRSGTTVLGRVLSIHREVGFLNEPKALWYTVCPKDDVNGHFSKGPASFQLTEEDATPRVCREAHRLFATYLSVTRGKRVLDKNPEMIFRTRFVRAIFPQAKFIFLVRDGWDTVSSIAEWSSRHRITAAHGTEDWWGLNQRKWRLMVSQLVPDEPMLCREHRDIQSFANDSDRAAAEWVITMQEGLRLLRTMPESIYQLRYEDLTRRPREAIEELLAFCDLSRDDVCLSYAERTLRPNSPRPPCALHPAVADPFRETMRALDYSRR